MSDVNWQEKYETLLAAYQQLAMAIAQSRGSWQVAPSVEPTVPPFVATISATLPGPVYAAILDTTAPGADRDRVTGIVRDLLASGAPEQDVVTAVLNGETVGV